MIATFKFFKNCKTLFQAVMAGNYVMSVASCLLASIDDHEVTRIITTIVGDLVRGEMFVKFDCVIYYPLKSLFKVFAKLVRSDICLQGS